MSWSDIQLLPASSAKQRSDITTEKCKQGKYSQNNQCDNGINASKQPGRLIAHIQNVHQEIFFNITQDQQHEVTDEKQRKNRSIFPEQSHTSFSIKHYPLVTQRNIFCRRLGQTFQHISHKDQQRQGKTSDYCRHPELVYLHFIHGKQAKAFCNSRAEHHAHPEQTGQDVRHLPSFDKTENHSPRTT